MAGNGRFSHKYGLKAEIEANELARFPYTGGSAEQVSTQVDEAR
jgi:hypothetical protein